MISPVLIRRASAFIPRKCTAAAMSTLVISEPVTSATVPAATLKALTAATQLSSPPVTLLLVGSDPCSASAAASAIPCVDAVISAPDTTTSESISAAVASGSYDYVVCSSTHHGRNVVPRIAAERGVPALSDCVEVSGDGTFVRPTYAGNAMARVRVDPAKGTVCLTVRHTAFEKAAEEGGSAEVTTLDPASHTLSEKISESVSGSGGRPDLGSASVVISGGRGMKNGENFAMLDTLADKLGGAVGASRAAVDAGYVPNDRQVGQTGKVVAPDLYIAVGISGAIQHLSGMKDSKTIVAINKDKEAPIFTVADYGLVSDLFDAVPELTEKV